MNNGKEVLSKLLVRSKGLLPSRAVNHEFASCLSNDELEEPVSQTGEAVSVGNHKLL